MISKDKVAGVNRAEEHWLIPFLNGQKVAAIIELAKRPLRKLDAWCDSLFVR